jgi:hypothetical protein
LAQNTWGTDVLSKIYGHPTVEIRITDCASSRRLLAEMAVFVAAYTHLCGKRVSDDKPTSDDYRDALVNRWSAAKYGLQASFRWNGAIVPVVDIIHEMINECNDELNDLGMRAEDFMLLNVMLEKRVCQADFVLELAKRYPDIYMFTSVYSKLIRNWDIFDEYLATAEVLEPVPSPDDEAIYNEHLSYIGENTHFYKTREAMWYPADLADDIIERMLHEGHIKREFTESSGMLLSRIKSGS